MSIAYISRAPQKIVFPFIHYFHGNVHGRNTHTCLRNVHIHNTTQRIVYAYIRVMSQGCEWVCIVCECVYARGGSGWWWACGPHMCLGRSPAVLQTRKRPKRRRPREKTRGWKVVSEGTKNTTLSAYVGYKYDKLSGGRAHSIIMMILCARNVWYTEWFFEQTHSIFNPV